MRHTMNRRPIFDAVRRLLGRGFRPSEVRALDDAIDVALSDGGGDPADKCYTVSDAGIALIKRFEGCRLSAYPDPGSGGEPWTIGWGTTRIDGQPVRSGMTISQAQADELLRADVARYAAEVAAALREAP